MSDLMEILTVSIHAFISWIASLIYLLYFHDKLDKIKFTAGHYLALIIVNVLVYSLFYKVNNRNLSQFTVMAISVITIFLLQYFVFKYIYRADLWFLNFEDYIVPVFITASVIYLLPNFIR